MTIGFDVNSLIREYALRMVRGELDIPAATSRMNFVPIDGELAVTEVDFQRMQLANSESFSTSGLAN